MDEEILQDFLVEASEILEQLGEQLIELEDNPEDQDLLNAIFRGFHTIKGGAGFLGLHALVSISHKSEDVFDLLRSHQRRVNASLMDVILQSLDVLNAQFDDLRAGEDPREAPSALIASLETLIRGDELPYPSAPAAEAAAAPVMPAPETLQAPAIPDQDSSIVKAFAEAEAVAPEPEVAPAVPFSTEPAAASSDEIQTISDDEFDAIMGGGVPAAASAAPSAGSGGHNQITEDEFEDLLDQLHGPGQFGAAGGAGTETGAVDAVEDQDPVGSLSDENITEDEFDALLDELHGAGQFRAEVAVTTGAPSAGANAAAPSAEAAAPAEVVATPAETAVATTSDAGSDMISEDEFDELLDTLHGPGKFQVDSAPAASPPAAAPRAAASTAPVAAGTPAQGAAATLTAVPPAPAPAPEAASGDAGNAPPPATRSGGGSDGGGDGRQRPAQAAETTVRVDTETLDRMMNMVGELVLIRNRLSNLQDELGNEDVTRTVANLDLVTSNLQSVAMQTRMQPIKKVFGRFPRVVRDLARNLGKKVRLEMHGEDTDLDKNLVEALSDPLVHLVRNSVDHGIETPDVREAAGKPAEGLLRLSAEQEGDHILLTIQDDGKGIDAEALRRKVISSGTMDAESASRLSNRECFELIFMPGLSTKEQISDVSGRGVGMDVVKTRINQLNGSIEIDSAVGEGTTISITLPLTLAIVPTLMVKLQDQPFALPLVNVQEIIDFDRKDVHRVDGQRALRVRGRVVPLYYLTDWLIEGGRQQGNEGGHVVIVKIGSQHAALLVDTLIGQEEVVIKPLGRLLQHTTRGLAGATITGDGHIALILDLPELLQVYGQRGAA